MNNDIKNAIEKSEAYNLKGYISKLKGLEYRLSVGSAVVEVLADIPMDKAFALERSIELLGFSDKTTCNTISPMQDSDFEYAFVSIKGAEDLKLALEHDIFPDELAAIVEQALDVVYGNEQRLSENFDNVSP